MAQQSRAQYKVDLADFYIFDNNEGQVTPSLVRTAHGNLADSTVFKTDDVSGDTSLPTSDNAKLPTVEAVRAYIDASMASGFTHVFTQDVDAGSFEINNLADGALSTDAVNKGQMDAADTLLQDQLDKIAQASQTLTIAASSITFDVDTSPVAKVTLTQNVSTFTFSNLSDGYGAILVVVQDATGSRTLAAPTGVTVNGTFQINSAANSVTIVEFINAGGTIICSTRNTGAGGGGGSAAIDGEYANFGSMTGDQGNQLQDYIYYVADASGHSEITTGYAYFQKLSTSTLAEADYRLISAEEDRSRISDKAETLQDAYDNGTGQINVSGGKPFQINNSGSAVFAFRNDGFLDAYGSNALSFTGSSIASQMNFAANFYNSLSAGELATKEAILKTGRHELYSATYTGTSSTVDADPGIRSFHGNAAPLTATFIYINKTDVISVDISSILNSLNKGDHIRFTTAPSQAAAPFGAGGEFLITGSLVLSGNYYKIPVVNIFWIGSNTFLNDFRIGFLTSLYETKDAEADHNIYFNSTSNTVSSPQQIYTTSDLTTYITNKTSTGDIVAIWVTGDGSSGETLTGLPQGRTYRIKGYGEDPTIKGSTRITDFADQGGNIWRATVSDYVYNLVVDGVRPALSTDGNTYTVTSWDNAAGKFVSADLFGVQTDDYFNGCFIDGKHAPWNLHRGTVTDYDADNGSSQAEVFIDRTKIDGNLTGTAGVTFDFQFYNHPDWVDADTPWAYDDANNYLYYYSTTNPNTTKVVEAVTEQYGISCGTSLTDDVKVTIEGLTIKNVGLDGINLFGKIHDSTIKDNTITHATRLAMFLRGASVETNNSNNVIDNNTMTSLGAGGILFYRPNVLTIKNNTISVYDTDEHVGFFQGVENSSETASTNGLGEAIHIANSVTNDDSQCEIYRNTITLSHVNGIIPAGTNNAVYENRISGYGRNGNDVGGIYLGGSWNVSNILYKNVIFDSNYSDRLTDLTNNASIGIYIDNFTSECYIIENTCYSNGTGIVINVEADDCVVQKNLLANNLEQLLIRHYSGSALPADNVTVTDNTMAIYTNDQRFFQIEANFDDSVTTYTKGKIDNNRYYSFVRGCGFEPRLFGLNQSEMGHGVSLKVWQDVLSDNGYTYYDQNSTITWFETPEYNISSTTNITITSGTVPDTMSTSTTGGHVDALGINLGLNSSTYSVPDGDAIRVVFDLSADVSGGAVRLIIREASGNLRLCFFDADITAKTCTAYWVNDTGAAENVTALFFYPIGLDGSTTITYTIDNVVVDKGTPGTVLTPVELQAPLNGRRSFSGPFEAMDGSGPGLAFSEPFLPKLTTSLTPKVLIERDPTIQFNV